MCIIYISIYLVLFALIYVASPQSNEKSMVICNKMQHHWALQRSKNLQKSKSLLNRSTFHLIFYPPGNQHIPPGEKENQRLGRGYVSSPAGYIPNLTNGNSPLKSSTPENLQINLGFGTNWKIAILRLSQTVISAKWPWHPRYRTTTCDLDKLFFTHSTMVYSLMCRIVFCCCRLYISKQSLGIFGSD